MRRPDIELSDAAAAYVERHPGVVEKLAAGIPNEEPTVSPEQRERFRGYVRERLAAARSGELAGVGADWLAKHGLTGLRVR